MASGCATRVTACLALLYSLVLSWQCLTPVRLLQLRDEVAKYKVGAPARVGLVAPNDVIVPGGNTGLDPSQTSFFQVCLDYQDVMLEALLVGCPVSNIMFSVGLQSTCRGILCWPDGLDISAPAMRASAALMCSCG